MKIELTCTNINCSVDSVVELLRAIKDLPDRVILPYGRVLFCIDTKWTEMNFTPYTDLPTTTIEEIMIACKAGTLFFVSLKQTNAKTFLNCYMEEEGEDMDLLERLASL